jgi:hypothetical protein
MQWIKWCRFGPRLTCMGGGGAGGAEEKVKKIGLEAGLRCVLGGK